jgi:hypothetical protein
MSVGPNGRIIHAAPALHQNPVQTLPGGSALEAAAAKTIAAQQQQAAAAKSLGAGQHGSGRRRRRKLRGGNQNVVLPSLPEGGTIPGVSHEKNHIDAVNNLNQLRADKVGDADINATPLKIGGTKRRRRTNGRRRNRSHRRSNRRNSHNRRRSRRYI